MKINNIKNVLLQAWLIYSDTQNNTIVNFEFMRDPQVIDTYAVQVTLKDRVVQFLLTGVHLNADLHELAEFIEECEFTSWPPTS